MARDHDHGIATRVVVACQDLPDLTTPSGDDDPQTISRR